MYQYRKIFFEGTGIRIIRQRFLSEVCAPGTCPSEPDKLRNTQQRQTPCVVLIFHAFPDSYRDREQIPPA